MDRWVDRLIVVLTVVAILLSPVLFDVMEYIREVPQ